MKTKPFSTCCTCGHQWETGLNGSHSCTENMQNTIDDLQSKLLKISEFLENTAVPVFSLAKIDYPVSFGPTSNYNDLKNIIKLINTK